MFEKARRVDKDRKKFKITRKISECGSNMLQNMNPVHDSSPMNF
jgi:DNA-binding IclR family transcriptional regulator